MFLVQLWSRHATESWFRYMGEALNPALPNGTGLIYKDGASLYKAGGGSYIRVRVRPKTTRDSERPTENMTIVGMVESTDLDEFRSSPAEKKKQK